MNQALAPDKSKGSIDARVFSILGEPGNPNLLLTDRWNEWRTKEAYPTWKEVGKVSGVSTGLPSPFDIFCGYTPFDLEPVFEHIGVPLYFAGISHDSVMPAFEGELWEATCSLPVSTVYLATKREDSPLVVAEGRIKFNSGLRMGLPEMLKEGIAWGKEVQLAKVGALSVVEGIANPSTLHLYHLE